MDLKEKGNELFRGGKYEEASAAYSDALRIRSLQGSARATVLSNRAACYLKLQRMKECIEDCTEALLLDGSQVKALFRRAMAQEQGNNYSAASDDLTKLIKIEPYNKDAISAARRVKEVLQSQQREATDVQRWLFAIANASTINTLNEALSVLIEICTDNSSNALEFGRKGGLLTILNLVNEFICGDIDSNTENKTNHTSKHVHAIKEESFEISQRALKLLLSVVSQPLFLTYFYSPEGFYGNENLSANENDINELHLKVSVEGKLTLRSAVTLLKRVFSSREASSPKLQLLKMSLALTAQLLSHKLSCVSDELYCEGKKQFIEENRLRLEDDVSFTFPMEEMHFLLRTLVSLLQNSLTDSDAEAFSLLGEFLCALLSHNTHYFDHHDHSGGVSSAIDTRNETLQSRRFRLRCEKIVVARVTHLCRVALKEHLLDTLMNALCLRHEEKHRQQSDLLVRRAAGSFFGRFVKQLNDEEVLQPLLKRFLCYDESDETEEKINEHIATSINSNSQSSKSGFKDQVCNLTMARILNSSPDETGGISREQRMCRVCLESALLTTHPSLGAWCLQQRGGLRNLLWLLHHSAVNLATHTNDALHTQNNSDVYQWYLESVAEELCLAASVTSLSQTMTFFIEHKVFHRLLLSTIPGVRAAAASALTKLAIQAKALSQSAEEANLILDAVLSVLKLHHKEYHHHHHNHHHASSSAANNNNKSISRTTDKLVSFSAHDVTASHKSSSNSTVDTVNHVSPTVISTASVERAVEVLAAMCGHSFIKEELVHGSYRVKSCLKELLSLADEIGVSADHKYNNNSIKSDKNSNNNCLDTRSTVYYGLAHILSQLTVTNKELKALALADKELSVEQYEQLQELQRLKTTDEYGNVIEEKKDDVDLDTRELCRERIKKLVSGGAVKSLVKLAGAMNVSVTTREKAIVSLRQICVEESVRGSFIQEGGFRLCCEVATTNTNNSNVANSKNKSSSSSSTHPTMDVSPLCRREASHAIAKSLVTTNPHVLSEHQRLGAMRPLLLLCKVSEATQLQQFEALLSLTNLLSCGETERNRFVSEKGIQAVHYLMFSSHLMVRRAATEVFCNLAQHEEFLKVLRDKEKLRLWLALVEDWENDEDTDHSTHHHKDQQEKFLTARAAMGTLAMACMDEQVTLTVVTEEGARSIVHALRQRQLDLIHRTLVCILHMLSHVPEEPKTATGQQKLQQQDVAKHVSQYLAQYNVIPALSQATQSIQKQENAAELEELMRSIVETMSTLLRDT